MGIFMALVQITLLQKVRHCHEVSFTVSPVSLSEIIQNIILSFPQKETSEHTQ